MADLKMFMAALSASTALMTATPAMAQAADGDTGGIEEIVVTAQRRTCPVLTAMS